MRRRFHIRELGNSMSLKVLNFKTTCNPLGSRKGCSTLSFLISPMRKLKPRERFLPKLTLQFSDKEEKESKSVSVFPLYCTGKATVFLFCRLGN